MKPWTIYGIIQRITEKFNKTKEEIKSISPIFKKSLHIFPIDVANDNRLNLEIAALQTPQYNIHRFGIFFCDSPRHADLLLVLGKCSIKMIEPLKETVNQMPQPFGILVIEDENDIGIPVKDLNLGNVLGYYEKSLTANELLNVLLNIMEAEND
ncbi:NADH ubiquinone dehydrogenase [Hippea maritima]|uniref:NADH ubiquinone oxidoreductase 20 kDa subunit n=1 Tax=Hippea maritima (strain ATCC 700847 / DSM 10411 / MH2) TaxID=760142 RepID=F2LXF9_HIPMA|nr:NADH ubiquinone dehydrogenase [Hippea maritima]AEA34273.1 NADH ubiquinone oxidoreductase 20 kDa subunit [Hippea maritima DSM 10411]